MLFMYRLGLGISTLINVGVGAHSLATSHNLKEANDFHFKNTRKALDCVSKLQDHVGQLQDHVGQLQDHVGQLQENVANSQKINRTLGHELGEAIITLADSQGTMAKVLMEHIIEQSEDIKTSRKLNNP